MPHRKPFPPAIVAHDLRWVIDIAESITMSRCRSSWSSLALPAALGYAALMVPYLNAATVAVFVLVMASSPPSWYSHGVCACRTLKRGRRRADELPAFWAVAKRRRRSARGPSTRFA
jgi:hypothetical protein